MHAKSKMYSIDILLKIWREWNMSNDLISRKELLEELKEILNEPHNTMFLMGIGAAISIIEHRETAFDEEKVIDKLRTLPELEVKQYPLHGKYIKKNIAIEIVEKGGV